MIRTSIYPMLVVDLMVEIFILEIAPQVIS